MKILHFVGSANASKYLRNVVQYLNAEQTNKKIELVFITGDITNSADESQWITAQQILSQIDQSKQMLWIPMIGNHDIWTYNDTFEEPFPTGDMQFGKYFYSQIQYVQKILQQRYQINMVYNDKVVPNPEHKNISSWFHNFWFPYKGNMTFVGLDWCSRQHAVKQLGYKGSMPGAELHKFNGGTWNWLEEQNFPQISKNTRNTVVLQHHPFKPPMGVPGAIFSFSEEKKHELRGLLKSKKPIDQWWGVFVGHFHLWQDVHAFDVLGWGSFEEWQSRASKVDGSFAIISVTKSGELVKEKHQPDAK